MGRRRVLTVFGLGALVAACLDFGALARCHDGACAEDPADAGGREPGPTDAARTDDAADAPEKTSCVREVTAGWGHACARTEGAAVWCWGQNNAQQTNPALPRASEQPAPSQVLAAGIRAVAAGDSFTCAVRERGQVSCWGYNARWQLGSSERGPGPLPVDLANGATALAAGFEHACAVGPDGAPVCWGSNVRGQLGSAALGERSLPVRVDIANAVQVALGFEHTCARLADGAVRCWGSNGYGQLGDGTTVDHDETSPAVLDDAVDLAAGHHHTCAVRRDGTVACWGLNNLGQLGDGTTELRTRPVAVEGLLEARRVTASGNAQTGAYAHTCALLRSGRVACWGSNGGGELGDGTQAPSPRPRVVLGVDDAVAVAAGAIHTCAARPAGVFCWGSGESGRLGTGGVASSTTPVANRVTCPLPRPEPPADGG